MTNYSESVSSVRVDQFRLSGKWYQTFALDMSSTPWAGDKILIHRAIEIALRQRLDEQGISRPALGCRMEAAGEGFYVILEPYHEHTYPQIVWF